MTITDADIERAIRRNLLKLDLLSDVTSCDPELEEIIDVLDSTVID